MADEKKQEVSTQTKKAGITSYLNNEAVKNNIVSVVGEKNSTRFISSVVSAVQTNPTLSQCTNGSILSAALLGEALQLTPSPQLGQYYMVPYDNSKSRTKEAQFQLGYKGYIQLAIRSGQYRKIVVSEVKEGEVNYFNPVTEEFSMNPILNTKDRNSRETVGYYAMFELMNGFRKELYWTKDMMQSHAETYSSGYRNDIRKHTAHTFWSKNYDAMAKKTLIRQLISKWGIMSIEMTKAYENDMAVIDENGNAHYVDNQISMQEVVAQDISENANTVEFEEGSFKEVPQATETDIASADTPDCFK
jgi:recombination protein RecT|nr:MAG TPA: RecT protein [Bacteriophage sp.]